MIGCGDLYWNMTADYRDKLTPHLFLQAIELLTRNADMAVREKELIKGIPEQETISAIIGSIKISMPGLQKFKSQMKSDKRKGKT